MALILRTVPQNGHAADESRQSIGYWPSPQYLRKRIVSGSRKRGTQHLGDGNDSLGSQLIIDLVQEDDPRPVGITVWGGGNTLAEAIWRVQRERGAAELREFLRKLRVYSITDQDRGQKTPFRDSSHQWMRREFADDLLFVWDECAWKYQNGTGKRNWAEYESHIQNHGHLGRVYPKFQYGVEGDTPAFLHLLPVGLNDPNIATHGSWGGYFDWGPGEDTETRCFTNCHTPQYETCRDLADHFYRATFNNFAARMDWAQDGRGNRNPRVDIDGDTTPDIVQRSPRAGTVVTVDASRSRDPDGDRLSFSWWILSADGTYQPSFRIEGCATSTAKITIPADSAGKTFHLICEVTDDGTHHLSAYRRIIFAPSESLP